MSTRTAPMTLLFNALVTGHHEAAWRQPGAQPHRLRELAYYQELAVTAEQGGFDAMFVADFFAFYPGVAFSPRWELDPLTLLSGVAAATTHLGIIATASTVFSSPRELATAFATLDQVSAGRAAWNIVTNGEPSAAANYGQANPITHHERYRLGVGVLDKVLAHWHEAPVTGSVPPTVQQPPVLVQAGSSPDGRDFAARYADIVFTAQHTLEQARAFRLEMRDRARAHGRPADAIRIIPGISPALGHSDDQAAAYKAALDADIAPQASLAWLAGFGIDLSGHDLDDAVPAHLGDIDRFEGIKSRFAVIADIIALHQPRTIRELLHRLAGSRGHATFTGTPAALADWMQDWLDQEAADGFMLMPLAYPRDLDIFVQQVCPLLRARGLLRPPGGPRTLRQRLGLPHRPIGTDFSSHKDSHHV